MSDVSGNGAGYPNANGSSIFPSGVQVTGPLTSGNIPATSGTALAGLGQTGPGFMGNAGFAIMAQVCVVTQASGATTIVLPAQSQILNMYAMVTTAFTGGTTTFEVGATAGTTAATAFAAAGVAGGTIGRVVIAPTTAAQIANWDNVSNATFQTTGPTDVEILITPANTGSGVMTFTVGYLQGINNAS
jgi:hypothetical protein